MTPTKTLLAIGAHFDDCVFGLPGTLVKAARKNYRVVILTLIGDRGNLAPVPGGNAALLESVTELCRSHGAEMVYLDFASGRFEPDARTKAAVAQAVADARPDLAFYLWGNDTHPDHVTAAAICQAAFLLGGRILGQEGFRSPARQFAYDNGPRHTIGFVPNTYVDISAEWDEANEWLGRLEALQLRRPYDPERPEMSRRGKAALASYRGLASGVRYAEAFWTPAARTTEIL